MEEKIITIALLPYSKAEILRSKLEAKGINCNLENVNLIQGAVATGVKVSIKAKDAKKALPILDEILGKIELTPLKTENSVVVPVDFSRYSLKAASIAIEISQKLGSKIIFYHVMPRLDFFSIPYSDVMPFDAGLYDHLKETEENAAQEFKKFLTQLASIVGEDLWETLQTEQIVKMGDAEEDILGYTDIHPPRVIVMGIKGPSTDSNDIMGSTTAGIIYKAKVPVLVIPEDAPILNLASVKKVVYATNFDDKDFLSIDKLLSLLAPFETDVTCLHIGTHDQHEWDDAKLKNMSKTLKKNYKNAKLKCRMVEGDDVLNELEKYIQGKNIDVLALTTHKRNMITRIFNPSIARKMVFHLKTPLLVFHA